MILDEARQVLQIEADGILNLIGRLDHRFDQMVEVILKATGRVIVSGIGKSGIIGRKIASTLASTGTPEAPLAGSRELIAGGVLSSVSVVAEAVGENAVGFIPPLLSRAWT